MSIDFYYCVSRALTLNSFLRGGATCYGLARFPRDVDSTIPCVLRGELSQNSDGMNIVLPVHTNPLFIVPFSPLLGRAVPARSGGTIHTYITSKFIQ